MAALGLRIQHLFMPLLCTVFMYILQALIQVSLGPSNQLMLYNYIYVLCTQYMHSHPTITLHTQGFYSRNKVNSWLCNHYQQVMLQFLFNSFILVQFQFPVYLQQGLITYTRIISSPGGEWRGQYQCRQCWAAILKNVSFKAIQIHNF